MHPSPPIECSAELATTQDEKQYFKEPSAGASPGCGKPTDSLRPSSPGPSNSPSRWSPSTMSAAVA